MSDSEKWAWWTIGVVALTTVAYATMFAFWGHNPVILASFAVLALTAVPKSSRRAIRARQFDEREREIAGKAWRAGFGACWVAVVALVMGTYFIKGFNAVLTVPVWALLEGMQAAYMLILAVEASATLVLYRGGSHA